MIIIITTIIQISYLERISNFSVDDGVLIARDSCQAVSKKLTSPGQGQGQDQQCRTFSRTPSQEIPPLDAAI